MKLARIASTVLFSTVSTFAGLGCVNKVHDENLALHDQNRELQTQLNERDGRLKSAPDGSQLSAMQKELDDRDAKIRELQANSARPAANMTAGGAADASNLGGVEATYDAKAGTLTVNLPGDVLFDAGKAVLKPSAMGTLDKIAAAIKKDYSGRAIKVDGYTDSDPITKTRDQWDDNWDLSYGRAKSVMQYLISHGVDQHALSVVANGSNKPKGTKPSSRRVEIVVVTR